MQELFVSIDVAEDSLTHDGHQCGLITFGRPLFQKEDGIWYPAIGQEVVAHLSNSHVDELLMSYKLKRGKSYKMKLIGQVEVQHASV